MRRILAKILALMMILVGSTVMADELKIEVLNEGSGDSAEQGNRVSVHYEGKLEDGSVFDASRPRGQSFSFTLGAGQVIQGWEQGVDGMKVGEIRRLTIPPELGYGASGAGGVIPPNATLTFEVELMDISQPVTLGQATPLELLEAQANGVVIIDIRREEEWQETGIIKGAETITAFTSTGRLHQDFQDKFIAVAPSPSTPILLYCRSGNRTESLGSALIEQLGFTNVTHLSDGIIGWQEKGFETEPYK